MGIVQQDVGDQPAIVVAADSPNAVGPASSAPPQGSVLEKMLAEVAHGRYDRAVEISRRTDHPDVVNGRGVCLMRMGKTNEAVILFRNLTLQPGCVWMRKDRPIHYKTNFATALLLTGHPIGCVDILHELGEPQPAVAHDLQRAIRQWAAALPWWPWLNWKTASIEPLDCPIALDFTPGQFGFELPANTVESEEATLAAVG